MGILSVEVLDQHAVTDLRRAARLARQEMHKYLRMADPILLLQQDISHFQARATLLENSVGAESPLPPVASHLVGKYEENADIALLLFAREKGRPVLVEFSGEPSKAGEGRLRQAAKSRNLKLRFFRLTGRWAIVEVHPSLDPAELDADFLKSVGVQG
jgi:hypothetical protein